MLVKSILISISLLFLQVLASKPTPASSYNEDLASLKKREDICGSEELAYNQHSGKCECDTEKAIEKKSYIVPCPGPIHDLRGFATCENNHGCEIHCFSEYELNKAGDDCECPKGMEHKKTGGCECKAGYVLSANGKSCQECPTGKVPNKQGTRCVLPPSAAAHHHHHNQHQRDFEELAFNPYGYNSLYNCGPQAIDCSTLDGVSAVQCVDGGCQIDACDEGFTPSTLDGSIVCLMA